MVQNNSLVAFINDDSMAANYPVAPGYTVALINANDPQDSKLFLKSAQPNGMPNPMRVFRLEDITPRGESDSVSRREFESVSKELAEMKALLAGLVKGGNAK